MLLMLRLYLVGWFLYASWTTLVREPLRFELAEQDTNDAYIEIPSEKETVLPQATCY